MNKIFDDEMRTGTGSGKTGPTGLDEGLTECDSYVFDGLHFTKDGLLSEFRSITRRMLSSDDSDYRIQCQDALSYLLEVAWNLGGEPLYSECLEA